MRNRQASIPTEPRTPTQCPECGSEDTRPFKGSPPWRFCNRCRHSFPVAD